MIYIIFMNYPLARLRVVMRAGAADIIGSYTGFPFLLRPRLPGGRLYTFFPYNGPRDVVLITLFPTVHPFG